MYKGPKSTDSLVFSSNNVFYIDLKACKNFIRSYFQPTFLTIYQVPLLHNEFSIWIGIQQHQNPTDNSPGCWATSLKVLWTSWEITAVSVLAWMRWIQIFREGGIWADARSSELLILIRVLICHHYDMDVWFLENSYGRESDLTAHGATVIGWTLRFFFSKWDRLRMQFYLTLTT